MKETDIQIPDEPREPDGGSDSAAPADGSAEPQGGAAGDTPYRNLWVPLILVPGALVVSILLVWVLFSSISGAEASLEQNLERIVEGGRNDRDQALFNLARQVSENQKASLEGREAPWPMEDGFLDRVRAALGEIDSDNHQARLALGILLGTHGDAEGVRILSQTLALSAEDDPDGSLRFVALENLALLGGENEVVQVVAILESDDEGLRNLAAAALGRLGGEPAREALLGALGDSSLDVRGSAAIALTKLDPPDESAALVLLDLIDPAIYAAENERDARKYRRGQIVSTNRVRAVEALARLRRPGDRATFEGLQKDPDVAVSEAAMRALADWPETP